MKKHNFKNLQVWQKAKVLIKEIYQITLDKNLTQVHLENIREGVFMNGRTINLDSISYINGKDKNEIGIENSNGGIKLIKQLFEKINYKIIKLDRVFSNFLNNSSNSIV